jgi:hypothetical protein
MVGAILRIGTLLYNGSGAINHTGSGKVVMQIDGANTITCTEASFSANYIASVELILI